MSNLKLVFFVFFKIFVLSSFPLCAAEKLNLCYRVYYFIPLGEACIGYLVDGNQIKIQSYLKTNTFASMVKKIDDRGFSLFDSGKFEFRFYQNEGGYVRDHFYSYDNKRLAYTITRYKEDKKVVKNGILKDNGLLDPYFYTLGIQCGYKNGFKLFYDDKQYDIPLAVSGDKKVITLKPEIKTRGLLVPKGVWTFYIDDYGALTDIFVEFTIGKAKLKLVSIEGDRGIIKKMCNIFK